MNALHSDVRALRGLIESVGSVAVLSGAGCSTASGIPDYRGPDGAWRRRRPMQFGEFARSAAARQRYWARSFRGWPHFEAARPNATHDGIARLERDGVAAGVITQNVDGLHHAAGSANVIELHGRLRDVICLDCGDRSRRSEVQRRLEVLNPGVPGSGGSVAPDGDADIDAHLAASFSVAPCARCGGTLKPDVVFFGENVPRDRVDDAMALVDDAHALLVLGSSLMVWSGYRFARRAADRRIPIAIVNLGVTRADDLATIKIEAPCADVLAAL